VKAADNPPPAPPTGVAVPTGLTVWSPSYGPTSQPAGAAAAAADLHATLAPFLTQPARAAPPPPDPRLAMADGAARVDGYLESAGLAAEPAALFALSATYAAQFDQLARAAADYTVDGMLKQRSAVFDALAAKLQARATTLAKTFTKALRDWPLMRDPGKELLLSKARADVLSVVSTVAIAPVRFGLEVLRQSLPADPADEGDRQLVESVGAMLWMRRAEWSTDPKLAEAVVGVWRRMVARYRDADFYAGYYSVLRIDRMARAWVAATNTMLQTGVFDPALRPPLVLAFERPDDPVALVEQALPATDAEDVLTAFGLRPGDQTGRVGGSRSSESVGPIRLPDRGARGT